MYQIYMITLLQRDTTYLYSVMVSTCTCMDIYHISTSINK